MMQAEMATDQAMAQGYSLRPSRRVILVSALAARAASCAMFVGTAATWVMSSAVMLFLRTLFLRSPCCSIAVDGCWDSDMLDKIV